MANVTLDGVTKQYDGGAPLLVRKVHADGPDQPIA